MNVKKIFSIWSLLILLVTGLYSLGLEFETADSLLSQVETQYNQVTDMRGFWNFDELDGKRVYDLSEYHNDGNFTTSHEFSDYPWNYPQRTGNSLYGRGINFEEFRYGSSQQPGLYTYPCAWDGGEIVNNWIQITDEDDEATDLEYVGPFFLDTVIFPYSYSTWNDVETGDGYIVDSYSSLPNVIISKLHYSDVNSISPGSYQLGFSSDRNYLGHLEFRVYDDNPSIVYNVISSEKIKLNEWHRLTICAKYVVTAIPSSSYFIYFYIDGKLDNYIQLPYFGGGPEIECPLKIGADPNSYIKQTNGGVSRFLSTVEALKHSQMYGIIDYVLMTYSPPIFTNYLSDPYNIGEELGIYDFDEGNGERAYDQSKYDRTIVWVDGNSPVWDSDINYRNGYNLKFKKDAENANDQITIQNSAELEPNKIGIRFDIKLNEVVDSNTYFIIGKQNNDQLPGPTSFAWYFYIDNWKKICFSVTYYDIVNGCTTQTITSSSSVNSNNKWVSIYGYAETNKMELYFNGVLESYYNNGINDPAKRIYYNGEDCDIYIGDCGSTNGFYGYFDNLVLYGDSRMNQISEKGFYPFENPYNNGGHAYFKDSSYYNNDIVTNLDTYQTLEVNGLWINNGCYGKSLFFEPFMRTDVHIENANIFNKDTSFSIELMFNLTLGGQYVCLLSQASDYNNIRRCWEIGINPTNHLFFQYYDTNTLQNIVVVESITNLKPSSQYGGNWHHALIQIIQKPEGYQDEIQIFIDGYLYENNIFKKNDITFENSNQDIYIGMFKGFQDYWPSKHYEGWIDEIRFCNGIRTLYEDSDFDGMSDINEIIRSNSSDQFHPYRHNSRNALVVAPIKYIDTNFEVTTFLPQKSFIPEINRVEFFDESYYQDSAIDIYKCLRELNYQDEDIVFLTTYNDEDNDFYFDYVYSVTKSSTVYYFHLDEVGVSSKFKDDSSFPFPIDGLATLNNFHNTLVSYDDGGYIGLKYAYGIDPVYSTISNMESQDNLFIFYMDHGGTGGNCPVDNDDPSEDQNNQDEFLILFDDGITYSDFIIYEDNGDIKEYVSFVAFKPVLYYDDNLRADLDGFHDQIENVVGDQYQYITFICHACHSEGMFDIGIRTDDRCLISSSLEDYTSYRYGPLFHEWLNGRQGVYKNPANYFFVEDADSKITNDLQGTGNDFLKALKYSSEGYSKCNFDNNVISITEMYFNSRWSSYLVEEIIKDKLSYSKPTLYKGDEIPEQLYL